MSKAKPTPARQPDTEELAAVVWSRLYSDDEYNDDRLHKWLATQPPASAKDVAALNYRTAKQRARNGDLAPLRKFLTNLTGDPDIAQYIARPHQPKHARKDYADSQPFTQEAMRIQGDNVRRIRQILKEETGKARVKAELVVEIAAKVLKCPPDEIRETIKRGY